MQVVQLDTNLFPGHFMSIDTNVVSISTSRHHKLRSHLQSRDTGMSSGSDCHGV